MEKEKIYKKLLVGTAILLFFVLLLFILMMYNGFKIVPPGVAVVKKSIEDKLKTSEPLTHKEADDIKKQARDFCNAPINKATTTVDASLCYAGIDSYLYVEAKKEVNEHICDLINDPATLANCRDNVFRLMANKRSDTKYCFLLSQQKQQQPCADDLSFSLAIRLPNEAKKYCDSIISLPLKLKCQKITNQVK